MNPTPPEIPDRGHLVWISLDPQAGHEQAGRRPALVLSPAAYNGLTGLALFCPITSQAKGYPFEVPLPDGLAVSGVVLADHVKCLDWQSRRAAFAGQAPGEVVAEVVRRLGLLLSGDQAWPNETAEGVLVDPSLSARIEALIEAHRTGGAAHDWQRDLAVQFGGLGVYGDVGGALMLHPDGSVLGIGWNDEVVSEASPGWRMIALAAASYRYPQLAALAPDRPTAAFPCWKCDGSGCSYCFGMGWWPDILRTSDSHQ